MSSLPFPGKVPKMDVIYMTRPQEERTVTEEDCTCNRDPVDGGHTPDCNRMKRDQPCERVSVMTAVGARYRYYKCARHGCPWPDEGKCPAKENERSNKLSNAQDAIPWNPTLGEYK